MAGLGYTVDDFRYLIGTNHYDDEDKEVYQCSDVVDEDFEDFGRQIVVYRRKFNRKTSGFGKVEKQSVFARDIAKYNRSERNNRIMRSIMSTR